MLIEENKIENKNENNSRIFMKTFYGLLLGKIGWLGGSIYDIRTTTV